jgi:folate-binding protein YgfZ
MNDDEYRAATVGAALFDLSDNTKIELSGPDALIFLHNLCTQDVKQLPAGTVCEAFLTTAKARVIAHVWIGHQPSAGQSNVLIDTVAGQAEKILQHLNHYLISEQVELNDRTQTLGMLRLVGPQSATLLSHATGAALSSLQPLRQMHVPGLGWIRRHLLLNIEGYDWIGPADQLGGLRERLEAAGAVRAGPQTHRVLRVEAGLPEYGSDIDENRLAMEAGRTAQAISYNKGCFLGQETIVMARDRGQVNRMLTGIKIAGTSPVPSAGTKLLRAGAEVGEITSAVISPRLGEIVALAYLRRGSWEAGTELIVEPATDGRIATACATPF